MLKKTIREMRREDLEKVSKIHVDAWRYNYKGIVPDMFLNELSYDIQREKWEKRLLLENEKQERMFILEVDNEIKGFVVGNVIDEQRGCISTIYFSPESQRQGYGTELFNYMREILNRESIEIWCLEENKCRKFYDKLGGVVKGRTTVTLGGRQIEEIQYILESN